MIFRQERGLRMKIASTARAYKGRSRAQREPTAEEIVSTAQAYSGRNCEHRAILQMIKAVVPAKSENCVSTEVTGSPYSFIPRSGYSHWRIFRLHHQCYPPILPYTDLGYLRHNRIYQNHFLSREYQSMDLWGLLDAAI